MDNRIDQRFKLLKSKKEPAFIPFITAGDPSLEVTRELILRLEKSGADIIELGIPFSDPIADGPVIQASYYRALTRGLKVADVFRLVKDLRRQTDMPIVSMVSYSIIFKTGAEKFVDSAIDAGFDGATIPDLPVEEADAIIRDAEKKNFRIICFVAPTTNLDRMTRIVKCTQGFLYYISVVGITGIRDSLAKDMAENIEKLRGMTDKPVALGFGISTPEHARAAGKVADGVIVGSALIKELERNMDKSPSEMVNAVGQLADRLAAGAKGKLETSGC
ncbi:MAG: tryptophan synthase subunit alpha [Candidatus Brocadiales bacterium]|nr:tryptophan synthase subunit alpha [Candidatus Bathyanammoxibius amoris]